MIEAAAHAISARRIGAPVTYLRSFLGGRAARLTGGCLGAAALLLTGGMPTSAQQSFGPPTLYTNEQFVKDVTGRTRLDLENVHSVLQYVLGQLPARVKVLPTENYYYFYFYWNGIRISGNFRFDIEERDKGLVEFIYFKDSTDWQEDETDHHATLGEEDGVKVEKVEALKYRVTYADESVLFELNDLADVRPPDDALGEDETFLGPVADESGIRFFLIFDKRLKLFHYVLDEAVPTGDELVDMEKLDHLLLGRRTGFAFLKDPVRARKLLVGVYAPNADVNNYLDGPFDQLPDNFLKGDELRRAILLAHPDEDSSIDRLGIHPDRDFRVSIDPYIQYYELEELAPVETCAGNQGPEVYACLGVLFSE